MRNTAEQQCMQDRIAWLDAPAAEKHSLAIAALLARSQARNSTRVHQGAAGCAVEQRGCLGQLQQERRLPAEDVVPCCGGGHRYHQSHRVTKLRQGMPCTRIPGSKMLLVPANMEVLSSCFLKPQHPLAWDETGCGCALFVVAHTSHPHEQRVDRGQAQGLGRHPRADVRQQRGQARLPQQRALAAHVGPCPEATR